MNSLIISTKRRAPLFLRIIGVFLIFLAIPSFLYEISGGRDPSDSNILTQLFHPLNPIAPITDLISLIGFRGLLLITAFFPINEVLTMAVGFSLVLFSKGKNTLLKGIFILSALSFLLNNFVLVGLVPYASLYPDLFYNQNKLSLLLDIIVISLLFSSSRKTNAKS